ncbi:Midasin, partial [Schistosoma japonicum]
SLVNITKWGHYTRFWSVKTTVDRCKKSIHKHVKNWESVLQRPVLPIFENAVKIPTYLKLINNNNTDHMCSSSSLKLEMIDFSKVLDHCSFNRSFTYLQQHLYDTDSEKPLNSTLHFKRLPSLIKCLHKHVYAMLHKSPILQWTKQLRCGLQMWIDYVHELSKQTEQLNSTCPTSNQLAKFNKRKLNKSSSCKSKSNRHGNNTNDESECDVEEEMEMKKTRQWYQEFTSLQQRKRLALSDWLKVAALKRSSTTTDNSLLVITDSAETIESIDSDDFNEEVVAEIHPDDHLFKELSLPNLGLSYHRGHRQTQTGHMSRFLVQLHGDPWSYVNQFISRNDADVVNTDSDDYFMHCVCNRLSRLIALRASLPRVPGPIDGSDGNTVATILSEIGGPNNLFRLVGIMSDLLNQCSKEFKVCSEFTRLSKETNQLVYEYANSLNVLMMSDNKVIDSKQKIIQHYYPCYASDFDRMKRIRISTQNLDLIIREHMYQWNIFWIAFQKQINNEPFDVSKLSCLFGSEGWSWLTNNPDFLSTCIKNPKQLINLTESYLHSLISAFNNVLMCTEHLLGLSTFLWNDAINTGYEKLASSMIHLQDTLNTLLNAYKNNGATLFTSVFEHLQLQINGEWDRIHCELKVMSHNTIEDEVSTFHTSTNSINMNIVYKPDVKFEQLANRSIHLMLKSIEILYKCDRISDNSDDYNHFDQLTLLHHFSTVISKLMTSTLLQVNKHLTSLRSMLQQKRSSSNDNNSIELENIFQSRLLIIQCIYPLMDGLSKALSVRCIQFWNLLDVWFKLGEFAMQITSRIISEGFCRPANLARDHELEVNEGGSSTSSKSDDGQQTTGGESGGTSLTSNTNDATGAKDVSDELECQEQIEGLLNDRKHEENEANKKGNENDNNGIEMPDDDFQGQYDDPDLENCDVDNDNHQTDEENFDDKMGESANDGSNEELAKEMWASDNEENEVNDNKQKRDSDGNKRNDKTGGVQDDDESSSRHSGAEQGADNIQEQDKRDPKRKEDVGNSDQTDSCDSNDELMNKSPKRKKSKRSHDAPNNRTTVANESIMQDELDEFDQDNNEKESGETKPNDIETSDVDVDKHDQGVPEDIDTESIYNEEDITERDIEDMPTDLFDNQKNLNEDDDEEGFSMLLLFFFSISICFCIVE